MEIVSKHERVPLVLGNKHSCF